MSETQFRWMEIDYSKPLKGVDGMYLTWHDQDGCPHDMLVQLQTKVGDGEWQTIPVQTLPREQKLAGWKRFEPLFAWRDQLTDYWGEDLVYLLAKMGAPVKEIDPRLPPELKPLWEEFRGVRSDERVNYAEAYVRATGWDGRSSYDR
jgi:hypothetical protein